MRHLPALYGFLISCALSLMGNSAPAEQYALGPGDLVDISVLSRPELTRAYRVRLDGSISLHILGHIQAEGRTPAELEADLEDQFSEIFEGSTSITVEVARYRSVIVGGEVSVPGAYEFFAGLDVAAAVALAGGLSGASEDETVGTQMRVEAEVARYALLRARLAARLVERARLLAERDGTADVPMPAEAEAALGNAARDILEAQEALRDVRDEQLSLRLTAEDARRTLAEEEASAYGERRNLIRSQVDATMEELAVQQGLAERGLALSQRSLDLRLSADRFRADELEAVALEAAAREKVSNAEAGKRSAVRLRDGEVAEALTAISSEIAELRTDIDLARRFVTKFGDPAAFSGMSGVQTTYRIRRRTGETVTVIEAGPDTALLPGDMVEVALDDPVMSDVGQDETQAGQ